MGQSELGTAVARRPDQVGMGSRKWAYGHRKIEHGGLQATARGAVAAPVPRPGGPWRVARRLALSLSPSPERRRSTAPRHVAPWRGAGARPGRIESVAGTDGSSETARVRPAPSPLPVHVLPPAPRAAGQGAGRADAAPVPFPHVISSWPRRAVTV